MQWHRLCLVPAVALVIGGCASFQPASQKPKGPTTAQRVDALQQKVDGLSRQVNAQGQVGLAAQVQSMQQTLRDLRGQIEENQHNLDQLRQRQRDLYVDLDKRVRALETGKSGTSQSAAPASAGSASAAGQSTQGSGKANGNAQKEYEAAFTLLKNGRYAKAVDAFRAFLQKHPDSRYAPNAQYWIGEAHYVSEDFTTALQDFQAVVKNYPSSNKVPDALLKIGYIHYQQKDWKQARSALQKVVSQYGNSGAAQLAKQRLARMNREGH